MFAIVYGGDENLTIPFTDDPSCYGSVAIFKRKLDAERMAEKWGETYRVVPVVINADAEVTVVKSVKLK